MNIADRARRYGEVHRVLQPGRRFALYDVVAGSGAAPHFPVPWSRGPQTSFLVTAVSMREALQELGLRVVSSTDRTKISVAWFEILPESSNVQLVQQVLSYAGDLDDVEIEEIGFDPFLVAAAMSSPDRVVVTREVSKKTQVRAKRRLPDVCETFSVRCVTDVKSYAGLTFALPV